MLPTELKMPRIGNEKMSLDQFVDQFKKIAGQECFRPQVLEGDTLEPVSKYFGLPWLAEGEVWPEMNGEKLVFVMQLNVSSLPQPYRRALGGDGLMQFFYCVEQFYEDAPLVRLVHTDGNASSATRNEADNMQNEWTPKIIVGWEKDTDYPHFEHLESICDMDFDEISDEFDVEIGEEIDMCIQGDKLGGWPFWTQGVETPDDEADQPMDYVMQLDAGCFFDGKAFPAHAPNLFASDGTGHIFVSKSNPKELAFVWACT